MQLVPEHSEKYARSIAALTAIGSIVWAQWPIELERIGIGLILTGSAALLSWISIELAGTASERRTRDSILVYDVIKMNDLIKIIDRRQAYILREHAIETYMRSDVYNGLTNLLDHYEDDIFPFNNKNLQERYVKFCRETKMFLNDFFHLYTSDGSGSMTWRTRDDSWVADDTYNEIMDAIYKLSGQATSLSNLWQELVTTALQELKGASVAINRYE